MTYKSKYQPEVDSLRAIAVLLVVLFHLDIPLMSGGFIGVDIFFVISGYLISRIIANHADNFSYRSFYLRRVRRLAPALIVTVVFTHIAAFFLFSPDYFIDYSQSAVSALFSFSNIFFWLRSDYFALESAFMPLLHTWSLSVEEQLYLIWPTILLLLFRYTGNALPLIPILIMAIASLMGAHLILASDPSAAFFLTPFRIVEFCMGAAMLRLPSADKLPNAAREVLLLLGYGIIFSVAFTYTSNTSFPGIASLLPCLGACLVIYAGAARYAGLPLRMRAMVFTGLISYSFYLIHWPLIAFYKYLTMAPLTPVAICGILFVSYALACAMHRFVEIPFRYPARDVEHRPFILATISCIILLAVPSASISATHGWTWRLDDSQRELQVSKDKARRDDLYGGAECPGGRCEENLQIGGTPIYMIGDSHARALHQGMKTYFPDLPLLVYANSGCDFFMTRYRYSIPTNRANCKRIRAEAVKEMRDKPGTIILAQRWIYYERFNSRILSQQDGKEYRLDELGYTSPSAFQELVRDQLLELSREFPRHRLVVIGPVPEFGRIGSPFDCALRPFGSNRSCGNTSVHSQHLAKMGAMDKMLANTLLPTGMTYLSPWPALCNEDSCINMLDSAPVYSDDNHLSLWGSKHVIQFLEPQIRAALETPQSLSASK